MSYDIPPSEQYGSTECKARDDKMPINNYKINIRNLEEDALKGLCLEGATRTAPIDVTSTID